ncbi:MAG TPA: peptidase MA family metallohydrolase [Thermomicrobiales bacterium]|nr:peptidase MA family metallohydrolase [Thermomicrobiales bacterium]
MRNLVRLLLVVALLGGFASVAPRTRAAQPPVIAATLDVEIDFPSTITFHLTAETPEPVTSAELRYTTSGKEYSNAAMVTFEKSSAVDAEYTVDAQIDYIEPGVDVVYSWVLHDANGPVARTAEESLTWIDDSFDWQRHDSDDVSVFTYDDEPDFDQYILQVAQESADKYKQEYDIDRIDPMRIWVYASDDDFATTLRQNSESWIGGFSLPEAGVIAVPIEPGDDYSVERVISHEVSHHVLYQATKNPFSYPPTWLDEGLAVIGQLAGNENDREIVLGAFAEGALPTLRTLSSSFPTDAAAANRSYATSHIAVQFLIDNWGQAAIADLIHQFRQSATADEALTAVIGLDTEGLDATFRDWLATQSD